MNRRMLSREDEEAAGDEIEVRREDQDKINRFSRLHQRELGIEEELKDKNKEKEELDDLDTELELVEDEEELVQYKIGDSFFHIPHAQAKEMLGIAAAKLEKEIEDLQDKLETIHIEMNGLKVDLYARFGRTINLET
ncbi:Prefoldin subunit-domain-containing protein [Pseudoneurospora amorphoporcata]|uniref:Prefoldin subunit 4 n=1 Tax=Pseudoneurospora amorphoporcata TaxID=241081 RepID=A0AAN6SIS7_9PEZI|nr:Prefoldin subunit-domain-containing protein [Pseudoneurospora amorphoporcata]